MIDQPAPAYQSPEQVAFKLFEIVAAIESKGLGAPQPGLQNADRAYVLDTYAECLSAVEGGRIRGEIAPAP